MIKRSGIPAMAMSALVLCGCQSEEEAIKLACDSANQVDNTLPPKARGEALAAYIEKNVKNDAVMHILTSDQPANAKAKQLEVVAARAGITDCALAKLWSSPPRPDFAMPPPPALAMPPASGSGTPAASGSAPSGPGDIQVVGALPLDTIRATVGKSATAFRACFGDGLTRDKNLEGVVRVRFVIGEDGKVASAEEVGSVMPDVKVTECIVDEFKKLTFPKPEKGTVSVVYPIMLKRS